MKKHFLPSLRRKFAIAGLIPGLAFLCCASASAQLLKNGDFESEFPVSDPTAGWALAYVESDAGDFSMAGHTTQASRTANGRGAHLRAEHPGPAHAYFKQVVTNLTEGASYTLSIQKMQAGFQNYIDNGKLSVYASLVSGATSNTVAGNGTVVGPYSLTITADASRQIEVQLHMSKLSMPEDVAEDFKSSKCSGWFDDAALALTP